jgi:hypothetical protein
MKAPNSPIPKYPRHIAGLDLGGAGEPSALAILEQAWRRSDSDPDRLLSRYALRYLKRWQPGTTYSEIVLDVSSAMANPMLQTPLLVIDQTGVGRSVLDLFRHTQMPAYIHRVAISTGQQSRMGDDGAWLVPRKDLAACVQLLLESSRLKIAAVEQRELLVNELLAFKVKNPIVSAETLEIWRERASDDLVLATAIGVWLGEKQGPPLAAIPTIIAQPRIPWRLKQSSAERRGFHGRRPSRPW